MSITEVTLFAAIHAEDCKLGATWIDTPFGDGLPYFACLDAISLDPGFGVRRWNNNYFELLRTWLRTIFHRNCSPARIPRAVPPLDPSGAEPIGRRLDDSIVELVTQSKSTQPGGGKTPGRLADR